MQPPNPYLNAHDNSDSDERIGNWREKEEGRRQGGGIDYQTEGRTDVGFFIGTNGKPK